MRQVTYLYQLQPPWLESFICIKLSMLPIEAAEKALLISGDNGLVVFVFSLLSAALGRIVSSVLAWSDKADGIL